jgi:hypothetical protein
LERHLQLQHQQQLLGLMGPTTGTTGSNHQAAENQDLRLNGSRANNNNNYLG